MKKILTLALLSLFISNALLAQRLLTKVPKDAAFVGVFKGKKVLEQVSLEELRQYHFGQDLLSAKTNGGKLLDGVDLNENIYYFISMTDSIAYNCILLPLDPQVNFTEKMQSRGTKIEKQGGFSLMKSYNDFTIWNDKTALIVFPFGMTRPSSYDYSYQDFYDEDVLVDAATEEVVEEVDEDVEEVDEDVEEIVEDAAQDATRYAVEAIPDNMGEILEEEEEVVIERVEEYEIEEPDQYRTQRLKRERAEERRRVDYEKREKAFKKKQDELSMKFALTILTNNSKANSIASNAMYIKSFNKKAAASFWTNSYGSLYMRLMGGGLRGLSRMGHNDMGMLTRLSSPEVNGIKEMTGNLFLRKDNAELEINTTMTDEMSKHYKSIGKRKFNKDFFKYFDGDKVMGYMGFAFNTENTIDAYPKIVKSMVKAVVPEYSEEASLAADFMSILLDGEEIGELINGDALFVISDVVEKELKYTTYEYDDDFNSTKVEKTKMEPMPEFIFMASTDRLDFFRRLFSIGEKYKTIVSETGNIFKLADKNIPMEVFFVLHDGIFFVTSSEYQARDIAAGKKGPTTRKHKKFARKQSSVFYANNDKILTAIPKGTFPRDMMPALDLFHSNFTTAEISVSKIKQNRVKTAMKINTAGKSKNSLKAFFDLLEQVYIAN